MNLNPVQFYTQLRDHPERPLAPLWVLHGNEPLLVIEAADLIRHTAQQQGFDERETLVASQGFRWNELIHAAGNLSLFGTQRLIDLRIPNGKPGREGGEVLQRYTRQLPQGTITLITLPEIDWQTRKTSWFKAVSEAGSVIELNAPELTELPRWIAQRLSNQKQSTPTEALTFIADHIEGNLLAAHQEILKLGLLYPEGELTLEQVTTAVLNVTRYDIDTLRQALLDGDTARCIRILDGLRGEGAAPPLILWAFANEIRALATLRAGQDAGENLTALFKTARIFDEPRKRRLQHALRRLHTPALNAALLHTARIDRMIKGLSSGEIWDEFSLLSQRLTRSASSVTR